RLARVAAVGELFPGPLPPPAARQRPPPPQAARRILLLSGENCGRAPQKLNRPPRPRCRPRPRPQPGGLPHIAVERLAEEALLVAEGGIEARRVDAHGLGQVRDRGTFVTVAPEYLQRLIERGAQIELARASDCYHFGPFLLVFY